MRNYRLICLVCAMTVVNTAAAIECLPVYEGAVLKECAICDIVQCIDDQCYYECGNDWEYNLSTCDDPWNPDPPDVCKENADTLYAQCLAEEESCIRQNCETCSNSTAGCGGKVYNIDPVVRTYSDSNAINEGPNTFICTYGYWQLGCSAGYYKNVNICEPCPDGGNSPTNNTGGIMSCYVTCAQGGCPSGQCSDGGGCFSYASAGGSTATGGNICYSSP